MYSEFIRQVIHITQYKDFKDIQTVCLPSLRFEEIELIYNLFLSDKESQKIAKSEIEINLEKALNIYQDQETKIFEIQAKIEQFVKEKDRSSVEFWEEKRNEIYNLLKELKDFISDCFDLELRYYPEIFQKPNRIELMEHFIPIFNENRKKFESDILHPKGRKKEKKKDLYDYLTNPEKYSYIIQPIREQYRHATPKDLFFMVYALIELGIFEKDTLDNSKIHLHRLLKVEFKDTAGTHQNFNNHCTNYYKDNTLETVSELEKHKKRITEISNKK